jgi:hypothetical protein|uniref:Uncharacterized protein n=1 Tax=Eutreptiella gymnastica TaxID=73025 RepID=A0A7S4FU24_9EUGL
MSLPGDPELTVLPSVELNIAHIGKTYIKTHASAAGSVLQTLPCNSIPQHGIRTAQTSMQSNTGNPAKLSHHGHHEQDLYAAVRDPDCPLRQPSNIQHSAGGG